MFGVITWLCLTFPNRVNICLSWWLMRRNCAMWEHCDLREHRHVPGGSETSSPVVKDCYRAFDCAMSYVLFRATATMNIMWYHKVDNDNMVAVKCWAVSAEHWVVERCTWICLPVCFSCPMQQVTNDLLLGKVTTLLYSSLFKSLVEAMPEWHDGMFFYAGDLEISKTNMRRLTILVHCEL